MPRAGVLTLALVQVCACSLLPTEAVNELYQPPDRLLSASDLVALFRSLPVRTSLGRSEAVRMVAAADASGDGLLSRAEYSAAAVHSGLLAAVAQPKPNFTVPESFDFTKPTCMQYSTVAGRCSTDAARYSADAHGPMHSRFAATRVQFDYSYHPMYTAERMAWQDALVSTVVRRSPPRSRPWIVYTAGAMCAGKSTVVRWMYSQGYLHQENTVHIDPDAFREAMPEWDGYVRRDTRTAGELSNREAGLLQEIAQEEAMREMQTVVVEGTLRDHEWFASVFSSIRSHHPSYRIAVLWVDVDDDVLPGRALAREAGTGRGVPLETLIASAQQVRTAAGVLGPLADFAVRLRSVGDPEVLPWIGGVRSWDDLAARFADVTACTR